MEADYGPKPPANHNELEKQEILKILKDAESARFKFSEQIKKDAIQPSFASPSAVPVWLTIIKVNAKNSYGGYTGFKYYICAWRDGQIFALNGPLDSDTYFGFWHYLK